MAKRRKKTETMPSMDIHGVHFTIKEIKESKVITGKVKFTARVNRDGRLIRELPLEFVLASAWRFPHNNVMVKAHLIYDPKNLYQVRFMDALREIGEVPIGVRECQFSSGSVTATLMADEKVIRYGKQSGSQELRLHGGGDVGTFRMYESKAHAFRGIIQSMKIQRTIGGDGRINFDVVPNEVLESIGFQELPDILRRGVSMWYGNPEEISEAGSDSVGWRERTEQEERNRMSFLEMIQEAVQ